MDQQVISDKRKYDNIRKITNGYEDDYTTGYLHDYSYFEANL